LNITKSRCEIQLGCTATAALPASACKIVHSVRQSVGISGRAEV